MKAAFLTCCLLLAGPAFADRLADNESIARVVQETINPKLATILLETPYDGFYKIRGSRRHGGDYKFTRIYDKESYPDDRWADQALEVAGRVDFESDAKTINGRRRPGATAYVVMFKGGLEGVRFEGEGDSLALVMIDQEDATRQDMAPTTPDEALFILDLSMN